MGTVPSSWRVVFAGTPEFAVPSLEALLAAGIHPLAVYTQPDRPAGRGRKPQASPVKRCAEQHGLPLQQPESMKADDAYATLAALQPDLLIVVAYGQLLQQRVLDAARVACINVHASLLPRWRGAAPIQRAILAGDPETGVSIMRMEQGLDAGPVYATRATPISPEDTGGTLHDRLASLGAEALLQALPGIVDGSLAPVPQPEAGITRARKLDKSEAWLDWSQDAAALARTVRAFDPWPVAQTRLGDETLRIFAARAEPRADTAAHGTIISAGPDGVLVATGEGALRLFEVQRPGGRRISAADFANQRALVGRAFG